MPKRTVAISIIAVFVLILFAVSVGAQQECPSPRLIDTITGSGEQDSPPFSTTTNSFRITYNATAQRDSSPFNLIVASADPNQSIGPTGDVMREGSASGESFANAPPGRYFIHILTTPDTQYTVKVEECGEGGQANPGEGTSGAGTAQPKSSTPPKAAPVQPPPPPPAQPKAAPVQPQPVPPAPAFNAGGPKRGPVPRMPDGGCPSEYSKVRGSGCYRS